MKRAHLDKIVDSFVARERQERLKSFLNSQKRYTDFLDELLHDARHIDSNVIEVLTANVRSAEGVVARMKALGVKGQAYLVGDCSPFSDGHVDNFETLLTACVGSMCDCMVYSWASNVAYYEGHEGFGYIYRRLENQRRAMR